MSAGQMLEDVERAVQGRVPIRFFGKMGGVIPMADDVLAALKSAGSGGDTS